MSNIQPDRNNPAPPCQYSFGKIAAIFLIVGPLIFGPIFYLVVDIGTHNGDPLHVKVDEAFGALFSPFGLMGFYVIAIIPSLIVTSFYESGYRHRTVGRRLRFALRLGAATNFLAWALVALVVLDVRATADRIFAAYVTAGAAAAGAISAFLCALILETI